MALALLTLLVGGCSVTFENDDSDWGGEDNQDRWYTAGLRAQRPVVVADDGSLPSLLDGLILEIAETLPSAGDGDPGSFSTASGVFGIEMYTPENTRAKVVVPNDRPYAGWVYFGVVRYDTWLDPDALRRRDEQSAVELDVGAVGPVTGMEDLQNNVHGVFDVDEANGWSNQLDNEPGVVLRASQRWRATYDEIDPDTHLAYDLLPGMQGALGNVDTHVGVGGLARLGVNLSRALDPLAGDRSRLLPRGRRHEAPTSFYVFGSLDGRFVIHNMFLDGNTFEDSNSVQEERFVSEAALGLGWELGDIRVVYARRVRSEEFVDQDEDQVYGSLTVSWTPDF